MNMSSITSRIRRPTKKAGLIAGGVVAAIVTAAVLVGIFWDKDKDKDPVVDEETDPVVDEQEVFIPEEAEVPETLDYVVWSNKFVSAHHNPDIGAVYSSSNAISTPAFKAFDGNPDTYWQTKKDYDLFDGTTGDYVIGSKQQDDRISKLGAGLRLNSSSKTHVVDGYEIRSHNALSWSFMVGSQVVDTQTVDEPPSGQTAVVVLNKQYEGSDFRLVIHKVVPGSGNLRVTHFDLFTYV